VGSKKGTHGNTPKQSKSLPDGIDKKMSHELQQIHKHPDVVERCKAEAREKGQIVTSRQVLKSVRNEAAEHPDRKKPGPVPKHYYLTGPRLKRPPRAIRPPSKTPKTAPRSSWKPKRV